MPTTVTASGLTSSRRTMRIRFRTTSSATSSRRRRASSGSPPTTGSTASTWKTTASNASTPATRTTAPRPSRCSRSRPRPTAPSSVPPRGGASPATTRRWAGFRHSMSRSSTLRRYVPFTTADRIPCCCIPCRRSWFGSVTSCPRREAWRCGKRSGSSPKAGSSRCSTAGRRSTWLRPMRKFTATSAATGSWLQWAKSPPRVVRCALSPNMATITCW